jgi:hypothetical protein
MFFTPKAGFARNPNGPLLVVRLQSWFPFVIQIAVNGHEWLTRQLMLVSYLILSFFFLFFVKFFYDFFLLLPHEDCFLVFNPAIRGMSWGRSINPSNHPPGQAPTRFLMHDAGSPCQWPADNHAAP